MYKFKGVSERMQKLHERTRNRVLRWDSERALIITDTYKKYDSCVPHIKRAQTLYDLCDKMFCRVEDEDILVTNMTPYFCGCTVNPDYNGMGWIPMMVRGGVWTLREDGLYHNPDTDEVPMTVSPEDVEKLESIEEFWKGRTFADKISAWMPDDYSELERLGVSHASGPFMMNVASGHSTPGYKKIINSGYAAIRKTAQDWMDENRLDITDDKMDKYVFYKAVTVTCDAASRLSHRYADACRSKAEGETGERKAELMSMADSLDWIAENPARTYREACQMELLYIQMLFMMNITTISSCGRFDQITGPFLERDLAEGRITLDEAQEITDNFFLNISRNWWGGFPGAISIIGIANTYMHTTIGGVDPKTGEDATNTVTYMVLETMGRLGLHDPTISLRMNKNTPDLLMECALETTKRVGGLPLYYNDEVVIPAVQRELGFTIEEARDYAMVGCQEVTGSGIEYAQCNGMAVPAAGTLYYPVMLDMALNNGINPMNHEQCELHTGYLYEMKDMEEVKKAYLDMVEYTLKRLTSLNCFIEYVVARELPHVILSISMEGCMESGKDVSEGGAKYNTFGGTATGLATVADSLSTIEYACFDKKLCTTRELYDAFIANWEGYEELQQKLIAKVPHFGNDDPYADKWMTFATHTYYDLCMKMKTKYCKYHRAGLYGAADHVGQGYATWATPDGRAAGAPIADAASPGAGRDVNGPTAVLNSSCCYDHGKFMDGVCLNIRFHPKALEREDGNKKLGDLIKAYMEAGGAEVQFNIVSADTMRAAQEDPDTYRDLVVRIAGYSAYFVELTHDCQESLIARTENSL